MNAIPTTASPDADGRRTPATDLGAPARLTFAHWGYRHATRANFTVRGLDLDIPAGQRVLLLGASGIGKSTILEGASGIIGAGAGVTTTGAGADAGPGAASSASGGNADANGGAVAPQGPVAAYEDADGGVTEGAILVDGVPVSRAHGRVGLVLQDPEAQAVFARFGDNVAFGPENMGVPREEIWPRVRQALDAVGMGDIQLHRSVMHLSGGQMQRLALAGALAMRPGVLLLDEPTANLDPEGVEQVVGAVRDVLERQGSTMVLVEHRAGPWMELIDRVVVLGKGDDGSTRIVADGTPGTVFADPTIDFDALGVWVPSRYPAAARQQLPAMASRRAEAEGAPIGDARAGDAPIGDALVGDAPIGDADTDGNAPVRDALVGDALVGDADADVNRDAPTGSGDVVLRAEDLAIGRNGKAIAEHIDLAFHAGEITALVGPNGAGKSTMSLTLAGLLEPVAGHVTASAALAHGVTAGGTDPCRWRSPELATRISYVFQNPEHQFAKATVLDEVMVAPLHAGLGEDEARRRANDLLERFGLARYAQANPYTLSGGEKRRLTVASALACAPGVLLLDEPTFGQDRATWLRMIELIGRLRDDGVCVIIVTHDEELVAALDARIVRMGEGGWRGDAADAGDAADTARIKVTPAAERTEAPKAASRSRLLATINPGFRFVGAFLVGLPMLVSLDPVSSGIMVAAMFVVFAALGIGPLRLVRSSWPVWIGAPGSAVTIILYGRVGGDVYWEWGLIHISELSVRLGVSTMLRVIAIGVPAVVLLLGIDPTDLADSFSENFHLPERFVYGGLAGMRLFSVLQDDWAALTASRRSRGLGNESKVKALVPQAFALLVLSIRRSSTLATAMEARGFGGETPRTHARVSPVRARDWAFLFVCVALPVAALLVAVVTGDFALFGDRATSSVH